MSIDESMAKKLFEALKKLSDVAQESCLAFNETGAGKEQLQKQHVKLMSNILGRAYDPFQRALMQKFETLTSARLRERVPHSANMRTIDLMDEVILSGDAVLQEFGCLMREAEETGIFRSGGVNNLALELERFKQWLSQNRTSL